MLLFIPPLPWLRTTTSGAVDSRWRHVLWRHVFSGWLPIPTKYKTLTRQNTDVLMICLFATLHVPNYRRSLDVSINSKANYTFCISAICWFTYSKDYCIKVRIFLEGLLPFMILVTQCKACHIKKEWEDATDRHIHKASWSRCDRCFALRSQTTM